MTAAILGAVTLLVLIPAGISLSASQSGEVSPAFIPRLIGFFFLAISGLGIILSIWHFGARRAAEATSDGGRPGAGRIAGAFTFLLVWPLLLTGLGFPIMLALSGAGINLYLKNEQIAPRSIAAAALTGVVTAAIIVVFFETFLSTPLPRSYWQWI